MKRQRLDWERLVAQLPPTPEEILPQAPYGFATRVTGEWRAARRDESLRRWANWSFRTALASVAACALLALIQRSRDGSILVPLPEPPAFTQLPIPR
jgi:hypothetical protein